MGTKYILILFLTLNLLANSYLIEEIEYANGKKSIEAINNKPKLNYSIDSISIQFNKYKKLKSSYGNIYLYDLSKNNQFFNALSFDKIKIDANFNDIDSLGVADKELFLKEDNYKLPKVKIIKLNMLYKKIDLSRLKYFVVISKKESSPLKSITFIKDRFTAKSKNSISIWVWKPKNLKLQKLLNYRANRVYIQIADSFEESLEKLKGSIEVYGLNGSPDAIYHKKMLFNDIKRVVKLKKRYSNIKGYQVDIEPYLLKDFKKNQDKILKKYLNLISQLKDECDKYNLKLSVVIPFWFDNIYINNRNLAFSIVDIADEVALMSYRSSINKAVELSKNILNYAKFAKKDIYIGLECMKIEDEKHTIYKVEDKLDFCLADSKIINGCKKLKKIREFIVSGDQISFYNNLDRLKKLPSYKVNYSSFKGFILHYLTILPPKIY